MRKKENKYEKFKKRVLRDVEVRKSFEEDFEELRLAVDLAKLRQKRGLTQTQLAAKIHSSPSVISRIENGQNFELKTLQKIAHALGAKFRVELVEARG